MKSFGTAKFLSFLLPGTLFAVMGLLNRMADAIIVGHVIGEDAFAGLNMIAPVLTGIAFFAYLIAMGTVTSYSIWMGRADRRRASGFFSQGLILAAVVGGALSALVWFGQDAYLAFLNGSEYVEMYARQYLEWTWPIGLTDCLLMLLGVFCCADGDIRLCSAAYVLVFVIHAVFSYCAVDGGMGASGCSLGTVIAEVVGIALLCSHFFRRVNTFVPTLRCSFADIRAICKASFGDAAFFLCDAALFCTVIKLFLTEFDSDYLPVAGVAIFLWRCVEIFNGVGVAAQPLVTVYWGERNVRGIRKVMQTALLAALVEGLMCTALAVSFPNAFVSAVGLEYPDLLAPAKLCVRLTGLAFLPMAVAALFKSYYLFVERPLVSLGTTVVCYLVAPVACLLVGVRFGSDALWLGLGLGPFLGVLAVAALLLVRHGRRGFPHLLPRRRLETMKMFSLVLTEEEIVKTSRAVAEALPESVAQRAALMVEEVFMLVREHNSKGRRLRGEVTLDLEDGATLTLRDDGEIFDITDADARVSSLRSYLVASVMQAHRARLNLVTAGFNRNVFRFT